MKLFFFSVYNRDRFKQDLHDFIGIPVNGVIVKSNRGIEPQEELLLPFSLSLNKDVSVHNVVFPLNPTQEFKVNFVVLFTN